MLAGSWRWVVIALPAMLLAAPAAAQVGEGLAVQPQIPQDYDRGRNVSVSETARPDYAPLGEHIGSFNLYPRVEIGTGATSNTYLDDRNPIASPYLYVRPTARLASNWSRNFVQLIGDATLRDYLGQSRRNERLWNIDAIGRLDVLSTLTVQGELNATKSFENLFSGEVAANVAALSRYRRDFASLQATYTSGRGRAFVIADYASFRFAPVPLFGGGELDQSDRNRGVARLTGQIEYARSPSLALFAQLGGSVTNYDRPLLLTGGPNLDSKAVRLLLGANVDIAGRVRGTIGIGYGIRDYDAPVYRTVHGLSVETRVEVFPLQRFTVTATGQRTIEDATLNRQPFWNTRFSLRGDYELLRNMILNATAEYSHQSYLRTSLSGDIARVGVGARYLASHRVNIQGALSFSHRSFNSAQLEGPVSDARIEAGIGYQL